MLFYDSTLSVNKKISCSSCHKQQYSFGDNVTLSANATNASGHTTRNAPALINLGNVGGQLSFTPYFWDGRQTTIEDAANDALTNEQKPNIPQILAYLDSTPQYSYLIKKAFGRPGNATQQIIVKALAQFIRTLVSEESRYDKLLRHEANLLNAQETRGMYIFLSQDSGDCVHCHADAPYSTFAFKPNPMRNNALDSVADYFGFADKGYGAITGDSADFGKFKIPTLRNVQVSAPYMHDGRFTTLEQVADHYGTRDSLKRSPTIDPLMERFVKPIPDLTLDQKQALVAFLNTLTDTAFLNNPNFSNPFHH
jgi:cytochrome c peroxidase